MYPGATPYLYPSGNVPQGYYPNMLPPAAVPRAWGAPPQGYPVSYGGPMGMVGRGGGQRGRGGPQRGGQGRGGVRRNQPQPVLEQEGEVLTLQALSQYPYEQQKLFLGEKLYPLIGKTHLALAGKITGMFLDSGWSIEELFYLLTDEAKLGEKIAHAIEVLENASPEQGVEGVPQ